MRGRKGFSVILLVFTALAFAIGASADEAAVRVEIAAESAGAMTIAVQIDALSVGTVPTALGAFAEIELDGSGVTTDIGRPRLPEIRRLIEIPEGASVQIRANARDEVELSLAEISDAFEVLPVQPSVVKLPGAREATEFVYDADAYAAGSAGDSPLADLSEIGRLRGRRVAWLTLRPVTYDPAEGTIRIATRVDVELSFPGADAEATQVMRARYADPRTDAIFARLAATPPAWRSKPASEYGPSSYLIIGTQALYDTTAFQEFVAWKRLKGYDVVFMTVAEAGGTAEAIHATILNAYATWERVPAYVLLLGDTDTVPFFIGQGGSSPTSDLYYQLMDDADLFPDIGVGRFPARDEQQLTNMVTKTLANERADFAQTNWVQTALFLASEDNHDISEGTHEYVIGTYMDPEGYASERFYTNEGATTMQVLTAVNAGASLVTYSGHGGVTSWADGPVVEQNEVRDLINTAYPIVFSFACVTGDYSYAEAFSETWLRATGGAVAMWASSVNSYWDEDDILERVMYDALFGGGDRMTPLPWIAGMTDYGKLGVWEYYNGDGLSRRYLEMYNIMGDPEQMVLTRVPEVPAYTLDGAITADESDLVVTVDTARPAMVGITMDGMPVGVGFTDASGVAPIVMFGPVEDKAELQVVISGQNLIPQSVPLTVGDQFEGPGVPFNPGDDDADDDDDLPADDDDLKGDDDDDDKGGDDAASDSGDGGGCGC
ncbi:MAG: hypothetical protein IT350_19660 [Deltaproteobacteria bacterium]|nr:hypothetical protein [Deltaproteobacteria bacterium]